MLCYFFIREFMGVRLNLLLLLRLNTLLLFCLLFNPELFVVIYIQRRSYIFIIISWKDTWNGIRWWILILFYLYQRGYLIFIVPIIIVIILWNLLTCIVITIIDARFHIIHLISLVLRLLSKNLVILCSNLLHSKLT